MVITPTITCPRTRLFKHALKRTLSGIEKRSARIPQWPEVIVERLCGPNIVAVEGDVLPAERRDVGKQIIADNLTLGTQLGHSATERNGVPEDGSDFMTMPSATISKIRLPG
jgi:hypothetical protein